MFSRFVRTLAAVAFVAGASAHAAPVKMGGMNAVRHVFVVVLENQDYQSIFGPKTVAPYLGLKLPRLGAMLNNYYATGHASLGNYLTMISGQPQAPATIADCRVYLDFTLAGAPAPIDADGIAKGDGCVYPAQVKTIVDQLEEKGFTWRGYMEDMGADPAREASTCARPAPGGNGVLPATPTDAYAYRHNPFVYFHSIVDRTAACNVNVVSFAPLQSDLKSIATTPNFVFIVPNVCNDGHDAPCKDGRPGGLVTADTWVKTWIPRIMASPAFKQDGLLIVTFDEAARDASACCNEPTGPNVQAPGYYGPGGGRVGAILLSPFIKSKTVVNVAINHYGFLKSVEDIFGLTHIGYAGDPSLATFAFAFPLL
jgi:hypothetical protein